MLGKILIKRLGIIPVKRSDIITQSKKVTFLAGCAGFGYEFKNTEIYNDSVLEISSEVIGVLSEIRGGNVGKVPLFEGFPENTPDDKEYFEKRVLGFVGNFLGLFQEGRKLDNGIVIPEWQSLNLVTSTGILLYEIIKQRREYSKNKRKSIYNNYKNSGIQYHKKYLKKFKKDGGMLKKSII